MSIDKYLKGNIMRLIEFLPVRDHIQEAVEEARIYLRDNPHILKETSNYTQVNNFLTQHISYSDDPIIGNVYMPVHIISYAFANALTVRTSEHMGVLVSISDDKRAYSLDINGKIENFPQGEVKAGDLTQYGLLYSDETDATHFLSALKLTFGEFDIRIRLINSSQ